MSELTGKNDLRRRNTRNSLLQGERSFSSFPSMNPIQRDMAAMNGSFITESRYVMLLTLEEAQQVTDELLGGVDSFFSYKLAPGNIKDILEGGSSMCKLMTYHNSAGDLVFRLQSAGIRAVKYIFKGKPYIKITGYPGLRRILEGTRYAVDHPQMLEMGIGIRGLGSALVKGTKFCIFASLAWRAIELIFKSDYHLVDFLGDITMDAAKIVVSSVVVGVIAGVFTVFSAPVVVTAVIVIFIGIGLNVGLNMLDDNLGISASLKGKIFFALEQYQKIHEWNYKHASPLFVHPFGFEY